MPPWTDIRILHLEFVWDARHMLFANVRGFAFALVATLFIFSNGQTQNVLLFGDDTAASPADPTSGTSAERVALVNATLHPMTGAQPFVGSLLITDGKIEAISEGVEIPAGVKQIDLKGFHITPGLIESRGKLWLTRAGITETSSRPTLNVVDAIDPWSKDWQELAAQGITSVYVQPARTSALGGYGALLRVGPHASEKIVLQDKVAIQAAIGITAKTSNARFTQVSALKKQLESAKKKMEAEKKKEEAAKKKESAQKKAADEKEKKSDAKKDSANKEEAKKSADKEETKETEDKPEDPVQLALQRVLEREIPLHVEVHHADAVKHLIKLAKELNIRLVLGGLSQVSSAADLIVESGFPVVVGPIYEQGATPAFRTNASYTWLEIAAKKNVLWAVSTFANDARSSRLLRVQSALAKRAGVGLDAALASLTSNPARMLGVGDRVGTLQPGREADIAVFAGDPTDPATPVRMVMSHGVVTFDATEVKPNELIVGSTSDFSLPADLPNQFAVQSSRVWVDGKLKPAVVVVDDGKIKRITKTAPKKIKVFDAGNLVITPGLTIAHSTLGQAANITDNTESDASHLRSVDGFNPLTETCRSTLKSGFIHIGLAPAATSTSSGAVGQVKLGADRYVVKPEVASLFAINSTARSANRFPASLNGQVQMLNDLFGGRIDGTSMYVSSAIEKSIIEAKKKSLEETTSGTRRAVFVVGNDLELQSAMRIAKTNKLSALVLGPNRLDETSAKQLLDSKLGMLIPSLSGPEYQERLSELANAINSGQDFAFAGESAERVRATASLLIGSGADPQKVMEGLVGGSVIGMNDTSLAKSSAADFVIWTDLPTRLSAKPVAIVVEGHHVSQK